MKDVLGILEHLGYRELRPEDTGEWASLSDVNGRYGTTDDVDVITRKRKATARLVDRDTGQLVATARKSCSIDRNQ